MATVAPSPRYTEPSRWFMEQLLELEVGTQNGGIYANKRGYHNTRLANQANWPGNYSIVLPPDLLGLPDKAAGYDWTFPTAQGADYALIDKYSSRLLAAGEANDPRTNGWREFYGQADADTAVEGWDFYHNGPRTSDASHLWHIHLSELRQFTNDMNNKQAMLSILSGESLEDWLGGGGMTAQENWAYGGSLPEQTFPFPDSAAHPPIQPDGEITLPATATTMGQWQVYAMRYAYLAYRYGHDGYMLAKANAAKLEAMDTKLDLLLASQGGGMVAHTHNLPAGATGGISTGP